MELGIAVMATSGIGIYVMLVLIVDRLSRIANALESLASNTHEEK